MSKLLLNNLNGNRRGLFKQFLDSFSGNPRIAWYPSAGEDFRALMYLNDAFSRREPCKGIEPAAPDLFLYTDYFPWTFSQFLRTPILYRDERTTIEIIDMERLPNVNLPLHEELVHFPEGGDFNDQALFMYVRVRSSVFGEFVRPVLYVFAENETFYAAKMRRFQAQISHVIHVRYGGGYGGGGNSAGAWLLNVLKDLHCELFITDGHHHWQNGDDFALTLCPEIPREVNVELKRIRQIHEMRWSSHGHVSWNLVA
jgi:hypothetical protein